MAKFYYPKTGQLADGHFKYVLLTNGRPYFFHNKSDFKGMNGTVYQWNEQSKEYQEVKK